MLEVIIGKTYIKGLLSIKHMLEEYYRLKHMLEDYYR